ncbi:MAG: PASTA domain-containing protein [Lachnospiraceae bacterium]|nr:PASTA domain-containing protein [Lachnospiraceae bacterium]
MKMCFFCMGMIDEASVICPLCGKIEKEEQERPYCLKAGTVLNSRYLIGHAIGGGSFGNTYVGWDNTLRRKIAIKEYMPTEFACRSEDGESISCFDEKKEEQFLIGKQKMLEEAKKLAQFRDEPGIAAVFDSFETGGTAYYVMEFLDGELLSERLKREKFINPEAVLEIIRPIFESLKKVHKKGIIHRGISPDNIFLTSEGTAKLIDFSASRSVTATHSRSLTMLVHPGYSPEEVYQSNNMIGKFTDVYSVAAVVFRMITGETPCDALERRVAIENGQKDPVETELEKNKKIPETIKNSVYNAMIVESANRTSDMAAFEEELFGNKNIVRKKDKIKKIMLYRWPIGLKIALSATLICLVLSGGFFAFGKRSRVKKNYNHKLDNSQMSEMMIEMPKIEEMYGDDAIKYLNSLGLDTTVIGSVSSEFLEPGTVVFQSIEPGKYVQKGSVVKLKISKGSGIAKAEDGYATVPYLLNESIDEALIDIRDAGLGTPNIHYAEHPLVAEGLIFSQSIDHGTKVAQGTVLELFVSKEKDENTPMPTPELTKAIIGETTPTPTPTSSLTPTPKVTYYHSFGKVFTDRDEAVEYSGSESDMVYNWFHDRGCWMFEQDAQGFSTYKYTDKYVQYNKIFLEMMDWYSGDHSDMSYTDYMNSRPRYNYLGYQDEVYHRWAFKYWPDYYKIFGDKDTTGMDGIDMCLRDEPENLINGKTEFGTFTKYKEEWCLMGNKWYEEIPQNTSYTRFNPSGKTKNDNGTKLYEAEIYGLCSWYHGDWDCKLYTGDASHHNIQYNYNCWIQFGECPMWCMAEENGVPYYETMFGGLEIQIAAGIGTGKKQLADEFLCTIMDRDNYYFESLY